MVLTASAEAKVFGARLIERTDDLLWFGRNRDQVRLEAGAGSLTSFAVAVEEEVGGRRASFLEG